jgi:photosystem II stability/assembly factor-like uncharacterized protein
VTNDFGASWQRAVTWTRKTIRRVAAVSSAEAWAVGDEGAILVSRDSGRRWRRVRVESGEDLLGLCFLTPALGWIVGRYGTIVHTSDGGETWVTQHPEQHQRDFYAVSFVSGEEGWIVGGGRGTFYAPIEHTTDGGLTWHCVPSHTTDGLFDLAWNGAGILCAVGRYGRVLRLDRGRTISRGENG